MNNHQSTSPGDQETYTTMAGMVPPEDLGDNHDAFHGLCTDNITEEQPIKHDANVRTFASLEGEINSDSNID